jgi:hypothetical protein
MGRRGDVCGLPRTATPATQLGRAAPCALVLQMGAHRAGSTRPRGGRGWRTNAEGAFLRSRVDPPGPAGLAFTEFLGRLYLGVRIMFDDGSQPARYASGADYTDEEAGGEDGKRRMRSQMLRGPVGSRCECGRCMASDQLVGAEV